MKKQFLQSGAAIVAVSLFLASCTSVKQNNVFLKRKYYNFKRHNVPLVIHTAVKTGNPVQEYKDNLVLVAPVNASISKSQPFGAAMPAERVRTGSPSKTPVKFLTGIKIHHPVITLNTKTNPISNNQLVENTPLLKSLNATPEHEQGDNNGGNIQPIVLIILAILLPPLAVYLYYHATNSRFIIDLVLWLIGVIFYWSFYLLFVPEACLLAAIIYAILIVTGSI